MASDTSAQTKIRNARNLVQQHKMKSTNESDSPGPGGHADVAPSLTPTPSTTALNGMLLCVLYVLMVYRVGVTLSIEVHT